MSSAVRPQTTPEDMAADTGAGGADRSLVTSRPVSGATRGLMQIGDVANRTGLSLRTVRHYEDVGLLPPAERSPGGFRLYAEAAVERLLVIKQMKPLEFTLEEMRALLDALDELAADPAPSRRDDLVETLLGYRLLVEQRMATLNERLTAARALHASLSALAEE